MRRTTVQHFGRGSNLHLSFAHGVSLHSHTSCSKESLEFIPKYARRSGFLGKIMGFAEWQYYSQTGNRLDCSRAYWTPPLSPRMALELEAEQIRKQFHLPAIVSLTDHDNCEAADGLDIPVSIEWTIPYAPSFFHLGVHNLPRASARQIAADMNAYTADPRASRLRDLLAFLNTQQDVLVVLNHPFWDEGLIGSAVHTELAGHFLKNYSQFIHALELNGLRGVEENERVLALAAAFNLPAISGGDRHGREPNANVNLTHAGSFAEFVEEIRRGQVSHVVYMPQYRETLRLRQFETAWDILRYDRHRDDGRNSWCHRVFFTTEEGVTRPLSFFFGENGPGVLVPFLALMRILEQPAVRPVLRAALGE
jgi:hypothetical protein